jgi:hypothetical protein
MYETHISKMKKNSSIDISVTSLKLRNNFVVNTKGGNNESQDF